MRKTLIRLLTLLALLPSLVCAMPVCERAQGEPGGADRPHCATADDGQTTVPMLLADCTDIEWQLASLKPLERDPAGEHGTAILPPTVAYPATLNRRSGHGTCGSPALLPDSVPLYLATLRIRI